MAYPVIPDVPQFVGDTRLTASKLIPLAAVAITAATPVDSYTPAAGKKIRILGYHLSLSVAGSIIMKQTAAEKLRTPLMAAGVGQSSPPMGQGVLFTAADAHLFLDVTATGAVSGWIAIEEE